MLPIQKHLYTFSRFGILKHPKHLPIYIFGTSSNGNSVYIKPFHIEIDLGLPLRTFQKVEPNFFSNVKYIFITHPHSDHLNSNTIWNVLIKYPHIKFIVSQETYLAMISYTVNNFNTEQKKQIKSTYRDRFIIAQHAIKLSNIHFTPYFTKHGDIVNMAVELEHNNFSILYATDLQTTKKDPQLGITGLPSDKCVQYNVLMLEANYDYNTLMEAQDKQNTSDHPLKLGNWRHLSEQKSKEYAREHTKTKGLYIPMHASKTFGNLTQDIKNEEEIKREQNKKNMETRTKQGITKKTQF